MSSLVDIEEIEIYDDGIEEYEVIKNVIDTRNQLDDAFYTLDLGIIIERQRDWMRNMPRVVPYYAVKCNPHPMAIKILASMNVNFDCASKQEIEQVMRYGISPDRIIFTHPCKFLSHIKFARSVGVNRMTADSKLELYKIQNLYSEAKIFIRFRFDCDSVLTRCIKLGSKFGCEPDEEAKELIRLTMDLGLTLYGFSFHVGSPCDEINAYARGIEICKKLITFAESIGCKDIKVIDIGGGFAGDSGCQIDEVSYVINDSIKGIDPRIEIISEPGRYYVSSAFTLAGIVHSKKTLSMGNSLKHMYYVNCGIYSGFMEEYLKLNSRCPISLFNPVSDKVYYSTIWGPTCDSYDCINRDVLLPEYHIGDWLVWKDMGAYTTSRTCDFNGFSSPAVHLFIRKNQWRDYCAITKRDVND